MDFLKFINSGSKKSSLIQDKVSSFLQLIQSYDPSCTDDEFNQLCDRMEEQWKVLEDYQEINHDAFLKWLAQDENEELYSYDLVGELENIHKKLQKIQKEKREYLSSLVSCLKGIIQLQEKSIEKHSRNQEKEPNSSIMKFSGSTSVPKMGSKFLVSVEDIMAEFGITPEKMAEFRKTPKKEEKTVENQTQKQEFSESQKQDIPFDSVMSEFGISSSSSIPVTEEDEISQSYKILQNLCDFDCKKSKDYFQKWGYLYDIYFQKPESRKHLIGSMHMEASDIIERLVEKQIQNFSVSSAFPATSSEEEYIGMGLYYNVCCNLMRFDGTHMKFFNQRYFSFEVDASELYIPCRICTEVYHNKGNLDFIAWHIRKRCDLQKACLFLGMMLCSFILRIPPITEISLAQEAHFRQTANTFEMKEFILSLIKLFDMEKEGLKVYRELETKLPLERFLKIFS